MDELLERAKTDAFWLLDRMFWAVAQLGNTVDVDMALTAITACQCQVAVSNAFRAS